MPRFKKSCTNCAESYLTYEEASRSIVRRCKRAYGSADKCAGYECWTPITEDGFGFDRGGGKAGRTA